MRAAGPYNNNAWHHVVATGGMRLYVDGTQVGSSATTATATYPGYFRDGYDSLTGWTNVPTSNYFNGTLNEAATYASTLTLADVQQHNAAAS